MKSSRIYRRQFWIITTLVLMVHTGFTQSVSYQAKGEEVWLEPVAGLFVAGQTENASTMKAKSAHPSTQNKALLPGLILLQSPGTVQPKSVPSYSSYDFVYPVYQYPQSGLKVYPQPEVIVKVKPGTDIFQIAARHNVSILRPLLFTDDQFVLQHFPNRTPFTVAAELSKNPNIVWATPNFAKEVKKRFVPNDPLYPNQWHLNNTGQFGGKPGADVKAEAAWDLVDADTSLVIAIVDDGIDTSHPDLNIYVNEIEQNGLAGVDDDQNGLIDDIHGWNFVANTNDPNPEDLSEDEGDFHGTSVAGVAAAIGNNGIGVVGSAPGVRVLPVKMLGGESSDESITEEEAIANALRYAATYADVINNSWGGPVLSDVVSDALDFATSNQAKRGDLGVPVLFASGNDSVLNPLILFEKTITFDAGQHTIDFIYEKNEAQSAGEDQVRIYTASLSSGGEGPGSEMTFEMPFSGDIPSQVEEGYLTILDYTELPAGEHTLTFEYTKDYSDSWGDDQVILLYGSIYASEEEWFDLNPYEEAFPDGVTSDGDLPFQLIPVEDADHYGYVSGAIGDDQVSRLTWTFTLSSPGEVEFYLDFYASTEKYADYFRIYLDGVELVKTYEISGGFDLDSNRRNYFDIEPLDDILPEGVSFDGDTPFSLTSETLNNGQESYFYVSGPIGDNQVSRMTWTFDTDQDSTDYVFSFSYLASTEANGDFFRVLVDGEEIVKTFNVGNASFSLPHSGLIPDDYNLAPLVGENLHPNIISIGASTDLDYRSDYSQWGPELDFVAPSNGGLVGIYTTDVTWAGIGYDPNSEYTESEESHFGGTSSACPLASGVVAMVLSANPTLSSDEIYTILQQTSVKIDDVTYDENGFSLHTGYGRLDMEAAVRLAIDMLETPVENWHLF
jgi:subtilisin family serine protease